jgi:hypothetical protein
MKSYSVKCFDDQIQWNLVEVLTIDSYPWYEEGEKQPTFVQMAKLKDGIHLKVKAMDVHASATVLDTNGPVYLDSCFEFFFTPKHQKSTSYLNLEINCVGTVYLATRNSKGKRMATEAEVDRISVITLFEKGHIRTENKQEKYWLLDIVIPIDLIKGLYDGPIDQDVWYGNFYRCGGLIDDQYAVWNEVVTTIPDFHQPMQFGQIVFG